MKIQSEASIQRATTPLKKMRNKKRLKPKTLIIFILFQIIVPIIMAPFVIFWGPFHAIKVIAVGSVYTSRHPQFLNYFLSQHEINQIIEQNLQSGGDSAQSIAKSNAINTGNGIEIENVQGKNALGNFHGKVMLIKDPKRVKVAITKEIGTSGERVSDFIQDAGAIAGINGGGFYDPEGKGNGAYPDGLTVHNGELIHNNVGNKPVNIIGLDKDGKLIIGDMSAEQVKSKNIQEAVHFEPNLIVDGKRTDFSDGPYGYAPRTAIGQKADGTIIFVVIDGRQPTWSLGANLSDLYNIFKAYGAVNAANWMEDHQQK